MQPVKVRSQVILAPDNTELHIWHAGDPSAEKTLLLIHGYGEYGGRYTDYLRPLLDRGFRVILPDVRGHGLSGGARGHVLRYSIYHDDLLALISALELDINDIAVLGHSHGGLIVASALARGLISPRAAVLSSPLMAVGVRAPAWKITLGRLVSKAVPKLSMPGEITPQFLTNDPAAVERYLSDPLIHHVANARWFTEMEAETAETLKRASAIDVPLLVMQAGADRIVSPEATRRFAEKVPGVIYEEIEGALHELLFELEGPERMERIVDWLVEQWPAT